MQRPLGTLAARNFSKSYGPSLVLDGVSLTVSPGRRVGIVGGNGGGKSTLLRLLAGLEQPDSGSVTREPPALTVGYLPQEPDARPGETLLDYLARRTGVADAAAELDRLTGELAHDASQAAAYADALDRFLALGGDDLEARARAVSGELGLPANRLGLPVEYLSGGEGARAALAATLLARFDVLLLDEPTNNLDFAGLEILERFVGGLRGGLVVVSHDRAFLDRVATSILELDRDTRRATEWPGGWSEYEAARTAARERHEQAYDSYEDERDRIREQQRRMQQWEERGYGQGRKKKKSKDVRKAYEKKLGRVEVVEKPWQPWRLQLDLQPRSRSGTAVARLDGAVVERGDFRVGPVSLHVGQGDRIAIVGPNGSGKTTLLGALLGRIPLAAGTRALGQGVVVGELPQGAGPFATAEPLLAAFTSVSRVPAEEARTLLAKFGLGADHVVRRGDSLSPGERSRAALALLAATGVNTLVLDEPTNHLDLPAIEELEAALEGFEGTVLLVTHDRRFLERFQPTQTLDLG